MSSVRIATLFDTPPQERMSAEDYIASPQSMHKSDLIEGVFVMASPVTYEHASIPACSSLTTLTQLRRRPGALASCSVKMQRTG